ncbi:MAG: hypothetical protein RLZZ241_1079 [Bacteroidota bacterium]
MSKAGLKISNPDIFERLRSGEVVPMNDPEFAKIHDAVNETITLRTELNDAQDVDTVRKILSKIIGESIDASTTVFPPFYTKYWQKYKVGQKCIYQSCLQFRLRARIPSIYKSHHLINFTVILSKQIQFTIGIATKTKVYPCIFGKGSEAGLFAVNLKG